MAALYDDRQIRQVQQAVDIVEVISSYVALKPAGRSMVGLCPFHDDSRPSMRVNPEGQFFKCFACGTGGDAIKFIMLRERMTFPEAIKLLADRSGVKLEEKQQTNQPSGGMDRNHLEKINRWAARYFRSQYENPTLGKSAQDYVANRGITPEIARSFGIGFAPDSWDNLANAARRDNIPLPPLSQLGLLIEKEQGGYYDRFRNRLIFPVLDGLKRVIAFGGRTLADDPAKYLNSPESVLFDKSRSLYGLHAAKDAIVKQKQAIIVEGYTDCIMAHQHDVKNTVATLGTALTPQHAKTLSRYTDRIILMFDSDPAGQKAATRAVDHFLDQPVEVAIVQLPEGKDPCDFLLEGGKDAFMAFVAGAVDALEYKWIQMKTTMEATDSVKGHKMAVEDFLSLVARTATEGHMDKISEGFLLNRVAKLIERPVRMVHETVAQINVRNRRSRHINQNATPSNNVTKIASNSLARSQQQIIEILMTRPELLSNVELVISSPDEIADPQLQQIARRTWDFCRQEERGTLGELMAVCESPELCRLITDMAERGRSYDDPELILSDALANIQHLKSKDERAELRSMISTAKDEFGKEAEGAMLMDILQRIKENPDPRKAGIRQ
ncbi:MAG: DNA primase [Phycisphaerae bacterium]|nr:DNA primase [Phycisphaerae bacterium]